MPDQSERPPRARRADIAAAVTALYDEHAVGFRKLAVVMLGDLAAAEDVVQDAFCGLYRRWHHLAEPEKALAYVRSAVFNGCRTHLRARTRASGRRVTHPGTRLDPVEEDALAADEHHRVMVAVRGLPPRQREALVLRYYLDLSERDAAAAMGVSQGTVKSTTARALAALGRMLMEEQ